jgi:hypothetical protein
MLDYGPRQIGIPAFTNSPQQTRQSQLLGLSFLWARNEARPRNHPFEGTSTRIIMVGLPASQHRPPNSQLSSQLAARRSDAWSRWAA